MEQKKWTDPRDENSPLPEIGQIVIVRIWWPGGTVAPRYDVASRVSVQGSDEWFWCSDSSGERIDEREVLGWAEMPEWDLD